MSASVIVFTAPGSGSWAALMIRRAWLALAWSSSWTASRALLAPWPPAVWASTAAAFALGGRGEGGPGLIGQDGEDRGELPGRVAGEVDDDGEACGQRRTGAEQTGDGVLVPGQDDGQLITPVVTGVGQFPVQPGEHLLAAVGQVTPRVYAGDHQDTANGSVDRVAE
jgi:hypothetical protein